MAFLHSVSNHCSVLTSFLGPSYHFHIIFSGSVIDKMHNISLNEVTSTQKSIPLLDLALKKTMTIDDVFDVVQVIFSNINATTVSVPLDR